MAVASIDFCFNLKSFIVLLFGFLEIALKKETITNIMTQWSQDKLLGRLKEYIGKVRNEPVPWPITWGSVETSTFNNHLGKTFHYCSGHHFHTELRALLMQQKVIKEGNPKAQTRVTISISLRFKSITLKDNYTGERKVRTISVWTHAQFAEYHQQIRR